ncbi:unnamed protein product [Dovyalis caffra]|uniref:Uncharacterized protein n=1 Tax=Dovyalis caffra TaxID=77055 RepID=A0AAV1RNE0_9ROSI|nr:unnamed protein product [Dovyalis caffra]
MEGVWLCLGDNLGAARVVAKEMAGCCWVACSRGGKLEAHQGCGLSSRLQDKLRLWRLSCQVGPFHYVPADLGGFLRIPILNPLKMTAAAPPSPHGLLGQPHPIQIPLPMQSTYKVSLSLDFSKLVAILLETEYKYPHNS